jgi:predicted CoA-binding protein
MNRTAIIGASPNPNRYSYEATLRLAAAGETVYPLGLRSGTIGDHPIITEKPQLDNIDTVTLYVGPQNQPHWEKYILELKPKRVIFNPGTENQEFIHTLEAHGITTEVACTLVLLATGSYRIA